MKKVRELPSWLEPKYILKVKIEGVLYFLRHPVYFIAGCLPIKLANKLPDEIIDGIHNSPDSYLRRYAWTSVIRECFRRKVVK